MDSTIATGIEIDELSGDGQTYTTVDTLSSSATTYTISPADPDAEATYYVYATDADGTNYSDPATVVPGIEAPTLSVVSVGQTSLTLAYTDPTEADLTLYWQEPGDLNMHAYTATLDTSGADDTIEIDNLEPGASYSFQLDAFTSDQDTNSGAPLQVMAQAPDSCQPTITGYSLDYSDGYFQDDVEITYTLPAGEGGDLWFVPTLDDDPYSVFYHSSSTYPDAEEDGDGGPIPDLGGGTCLGTTDGVSTYVQDFGLYASDQNVSLQLERITGNDTIEFSNQMNVSVGPSFVTEESGEDSDFYSIPSPPTLSSSVDEGTGDVEVTVSGAVPCGFETEFDMYAVEGDQAVLIGGGVPGDSGETVDIGSAYQGVPIFAAYFAYIDKDWFGSEGSSPYWSSYSNVVNGDGDGGGGNDVVTPAAPSNLTANLINDGKAFLHWTDNSNNEDTFEIDVKGPSTPSNLDGWVSVATGIPYDTTSYIVTGDAITAALGSSATVFGQLFQVEGVDGLGPATAPASTQPAITGTGVMDKVENLYAKANPSFTPQQQIANVSAALAKAASYLSAADKANVKLFVDTQEAILNELANNAPTWNAGEQTWLLNVCEDFVRPLAESLYQRGNNLPITDPGWRVFFVQLDAGNFDHVKLKEGLPVEKVYAVAHAMAINHINNDLKASLTINGIGRQALWNYIGAVVDQESKAAVSADAFGQMMKPIAEWMDAAWDVSAIRDLMRAGVPASLPSPWPSKQIYVPPSLSQQYLNNQQ